MKKPIEFSLILTALIVTTLYVWGQTNRSFLYEFSNALPPVLALIAFCPAAIGLTKFGVDRSDRVSMVWLGYATGMFMWLIGETTWAIYTLLFGIPIPFPSTADVFWLAGYVPLLVALLSQVWPFREAFASGTMRVSILLAFGLAALLMYFLIPPTYVLELGENFSTLVVGLAYPLLDATLLLVALPVLVLFRKGIFWRPFLFVIIGLTLTFVADILFTWAILSETYYDGSYLELFFHWGYLTLAYGFYLRLKAGPPSNALLGHRSTNV